MPNRQRLDRAQERMREQGIDAYMVLTHDDCGEQYVPGTSHSIGLDFEEMPRPTIHPADSRIELVEGMMLTVGHSVLSVPGVGGVRIEDTFHLRDGRAQPLVECDVEFELPA